MGSVRLLILCALAAATLQGGAFAKRRTNTGGQSWMDESGEAETESQGVCSEKAVSDVCICGKSTMKTLQTYYQCSECKDKTKWGYGCDMDCPEHCVDGCDFSGNCIRHTQNCKRNGRINNPTAEDEVLNERQECQACKDGFHGILCEKTCPTGCRKEKSIEGHCTRGGKCYICQKGFWGEECEKPCPKNCPKGKCTMRDGPSEDDPELWLPAGSCSERCTNGNFYGDACQDPCPANCGGSKTPNCDRAEGTCFKCKEKKFWGPKCEKECASGCGDGTCDFETGICRSELCKKGWWGARCDRECPEHTGPEGCERKDGFPLTCEETFYPQRTKVTDKDGHAFTHWKVTMQGVCMSCPDECKDNKCDIDGKCHSCIEGKYGEYCEKDCKFCDGPCDVATTGKDGRCEKCKPGRTGEKCYDKCHSQCATCTQYPSSALALFSKSGNTKKDCTSCSEMEPSELDGHTCVCIEGAERAGENEKCECSQPEDKSKRAVFLVNPKRCEEQCNDDPDGGKMRLVISVPKKISSCIPNALYKSVIRHEDSLVQGDCEDGFLEIPMRDGEKPCLLKDYADHINSEFNA